jgi:hypothetical protein
VREKKRNKWLCLCAVQHEREKEVRDDVQCAPREDAEKLKQRIRNKAKKKKKKTMLKI